MKAEWWNGLAGGVLIGLGSVLAYAVTQKVPGISGVFGRLLRASTPDKVWRVLFLLGLIAGAGICFATSASASVFRIPEGRSHLVYAVAGLLVGFGTRLGGGCTSGHGVCGIGMGARDSMVATLLFMASGIATVLVWNTLPGQ
jgi:uncharacterized membrane protein YedE/YeeE